MSKRINCSVAKEVDMVDYLAKLGYRAEKIGGDDYWYESPLREEKHPSFKVNRKRNVWYDHGIGKGGSLIDFGMAYFKCSVNDFLSRLEADFRTGFPFPERVADERKNELGKESKIRILKTQEISFRPLKEYLIQRAIPIDMARQFCKEVQFQIRDKKYTALGFQNDAGGWELRNRFFKGSSAPKAIRMIKGSEDKSLCVFEGFFTFLSWQVLQDKKLPHERTDSHNILVLNSLSFFEKSRKAMEGFKVVDLYLDRDRAGMKATQLAISWSDKYQDKSLLYPSYKDLNEYLIHDHPLKLNRSHSRRI